MTHSALVRSRRLLGPTPCHGCGQPVTVERVWLRVDRGRMLVLRTLGPKDLVGIPGPKRKRHVCKTTPHAAAVRGPSSPKAAAAPMSEVAMG